jgi:hypothetical protein
MIPEDIGVFEYRSPVDTFIRKYRVWVIFDPETGLVDFIFYASDSLTITASTGPLRRSECRHKHEQAIFAFATSCVAPSEDDFEVIEPFGDNDIVEWRT